MFIGTQCRLKPIHDIDSIDWYPDEISVSVVVVALSDIELELLAEIDRKAIKLTFRSSRASERNNLIDFFIGNMKMRFHFECILTFGTVLMACLVTCVYLAANSVLSYKFHMRPQMSRQVSEWVSEFFVSKYNANFTSNKRVTKTQTNSFECGNYWLPWFIFY